MKLFLKTATLGTIGVAISLQTTAAKSQERLVYTLPNVERVAVQKDIEYRKVEGRPLRFDFY